MNRALFLDRDGVINRMINYRYGYDSPQHVRDVILVPGIEKVIRIGRELGYKILIITNQPGVAKGKLRVSADLKIRVRIRQLLTLAGANWDEYYACYHHPQALKEQYRVACDCRKPKPGLLLKAKEQFQLDLGQSIFLGDGAVDVEAGRAAGVRTLLYLHKENTPEKVIAAEESKPDLRIESLEDFVPILTKLNQLA